MGFLDNLDDPQKFALLQAAAGMLQGGPGKANFGADLSRGIMGGLQGYSHGKAMQTKLAEEEQQRQMRAIALQQAQQGQQDQQGYRSAVQSAPDMSKPMLPNMSPTNENAAALAAAPKPSPYDQASKMVEYLRSKNVAEQHIKPYVEQMEKMRPKYKADQQIVNLPGGKLGLLNVADDGSMNVLPYTPAEKNHAVNLGGKEAMIGEYTGKQTNIFDKTLSPDTLFTGGVTMRGQNITDARARELNAITREGQNSQILNEPNQGPLLVNKMTGTAKPIVGAQGAVPSENIAKQQRGAKGVLTLLDEAEKLLPGATNSAVGRGADYGAMAFGYATKGAEHTAKLQAIEGALLSSMPRMEGPQSNMDVENYKKAAGNLANPLLPRELRQAALETIRGIQEKYAGVEHNTIGIDSIVNKYTRPR